MSKWQVCMLLTSVSSYSIYLTQIFQSQFDSILNVSVCCVLVSLCASVTGINR